jgi:hypothetical protein
VFVPTHDDKPVAQARYAVAAGGAPFAEFTVDHAAAAGSWVDVGSFPVHQRQVAVRLTAERHAGAAGSRLALAQVRVVCGG